MPIWGWVDREGGTGVLGYVGKAVEKAVDLAIGEGLEGVAMKGPWESGREDRGTLDRSSWRRGGQKVEGVEVLQKCRNGEGA